MSERATYRVENPTDDELWIPCSQCGQVTCHRVMTRVASSDESENGEVQVWDWHEVVQCGGCRAVSFCHASQCSEDFDFDPRTGEQFLSVTKKLYPSRVAGRPLLRDAHYLPHGVYLIYQEAHGALSNDLRISAGFGIRAIVEAVCKDRSVDGKDLQKKIDALADDGDITSAGAKILHSLRFMGNEAVHEMKRHTDEEMSAAFDVIENLLQNVYIIPRHAERLPKKGS